MACVGQAELCMARELDPEFGGKDEHARDDEAASIKREGLFPPLIASAKNLG